MPTAQRWRAVVSALCIVLAALLVIVTVISGWSRSLLVDEERFVQTLAPLATEPAVQQAVANRVTETIVASTDLELITDDLVDGLEDLGISQRAADALELLRGSAREGLVSIVEQSTSELVNSDAFATVWEKALRASHRTLLITATGGTADGTLALNESGTVSLNLGPMIESVKENLIDRGMVFASAIPEIDTDIEIAQSDALITVSVVYAVAVAVGSWIPVLTVLLFLAGIALARRRSTAVLGTGIGIALSAITLSATFGIGHSVLVAVAAPRGISPTAVTAIYQQVTDAMAATATTLTWLGILLAIAGWLSGRWRPARWLRAQARNAVAAIRAPKKPVPA